MLGLGFLIFREMRIDNPIVNFRVLGERNFAAVAASSSSVPTRVLYAASTSLPGLLQSAVRLRRLRLGTGAVALRVVRRPDDAGRRLLSSVGASTPAG